MQTPADDAALATAADLPAIERLVADPLRVRQIALALADPRRRVLVGRAGTDVGGLVVLDGSDEVAVARRIGPTGGLGDVVLGLDDVVLATAADMGCTHVVVDGGSPTPVPDPPADLAGRFIRLAARAATAAAVAAARTGGQGHATTKADGSVSAEADRAADVESARILDGLGVPMLSEEREDLTLDDPAAPWLVVDPIDGTGNYRAGFPPWAFAAGLVADGRPVAGYVADLSSGRRWWGVVGRGAWRDGHRVAAGPGATLVVPTPPPGATAAVPDGFRRIRVTGCTAIDLCLVADGSAGAWHDLDRAGTHVHDVAGALGVLVAAGGVVVDAGGAPLVLPPDTEGLIRFVAAGDVATAEGLVAAFGGGAEA